MRYITSREHPLFKKLAKLQHSARQRRKEGLALLDGVHLLQAYLATERTPEMLVISESGREHPEIRQLLAYCQGQSRNNCLVLSDVLFSQISPVKTPVGVMALIRLIQSVPVEINDFDFCVMLEAIQDPGNLGSILRSAAAAGVSDVFLSADCADSWSFKTLRAGMGAHFSLRIHEHSDLLNLARRYSGQVVAATPTGTHSIFQIDLRGPTIFIFGSEGSGLSKPVLAIASRQATIPMAGRSESLNVAAAAAICMFEKVRQHEFGCSQFTTAGLK